MLFLCYPFQFLPLFSSFSAYPFGVFCRSWPASCRLIPAAYHKRQRYSVFKVHASITCNQAAQTALYRLFTSFFLTYGCIFGIAFGFMATRPPPGTHKPETSCKPLCNGCLFVVVPVTILYHAPPMLSIGSLKNILKSFKPSKQARKTPILYLYIVSLYTICNRLYILSILRLYVY